MTEPTDQQLIDQYFKLGEALDKINDEFKKRAEPYAAGIAAIKGMLHDRLNKRGAKHTSVDGGTAFKIVSMSTKVADKDAYIRFCLSDPDWGASLLTAHVSRDAIKTFLEQHEERPPPGVEVSYFEQVQIRRVA